MPARTTLLIVDQSLRDGAGHHFEYDVAVVAAAAARGLRTVVGANAGVSGLDVGADRIHAWFRHTWLEANQSRTTRRALLVIDRLPMALRPSAVRFGSWLRAAVRRIAGRATAHVPPPSRFGSEVVALVRHERLGSGDHVLIHTLSVPELDSLIDAAVGESGLPSIHVVLRRDADEPSVRNGPGGGIRGSFARIAAQGSAGRFRFHTDTEALAAQYTALAGGLPVHVLPIPHCLGSADPGDGGRVPGPLRLVYLGDARREKGFHHLPAVVAALAEDRSPARKVRFILQANTTAFGSDRDVEAARRWLAARPADEVELIDAPLSVPAFQRLLVSADIVLLPYDAEAYRRRSSGILVQALAMGRPVVVPAGTWLAAEVDPAAAVVFDAPSDLPAAVQSAVANWNNLNAVAQLRRAIVFTHHSSAHFVLELMGDHLESAK